MLLVFFQSIFMIKYACYTSTLRGNDTSRTYDNMISRQFNIMVYVHATAMIEIVPYSNSIIIV